MLLRLAYPMKIVTMVKRWCIWWLALARVSDCVCLQWIKKLFKQLVQSIGLCFPLSPLPLPSFLCPFLTSPPSLPLFLTSTHPSLTTFHPSPIPPSSLLLPSLPPSYLYLRNIAKLAMFSTKHSGTSCSWAGAWEGKREKSARALCLSFYVMYIQQRNLREISKMFVQLQRT